MTKKRILAVSLSALFAVTLVVFIFWNSSKIADESAAASDRITVVLENTLEYFEIESDRDTLSFAIRKTGHFIEYFALSEACAVLLYSLFLSKKFTLAAPVFSTVIAITDEFVIQNAASGRSPEWRDVGIDLCGALIAYCVFALLISAREKRKSGKEKK